ncbi:wax ester/triacylglycerol synthase family O-acyltransferase [Rhodococcus spongiicola]|uniref:Diacylglycerol O-acyltransferase n=2 Tax=Rhodococcus spongiicola TaxID=2487352 RepID=A0A3S3A6Z0_9NOCA|nr:wax ester/triacylglycerol synthase family O-acyltransferase [Rhodococcus spongiicola]
MDASFLYLETPTQMLHVCGLIIMDGSTIPGGYSFAKLRDELAIRVEAMPSFKRRLADTRFNLDHPVWVDDPDFDIERHVHRIAVPAGGREELAELCGSIASQPMDRARPLWEMFFIEGLEDGSIAVMSKMHHANVDGVTGANLMSQLCSLEPDAPRPDFDHIPNGAGTASSLDIAVDGMLAFVARPLRIAKMLPGSLALLPRWIERARKGEAMPAPFTAPRTSLNGAITGHRSIAYGELSLDDVKLVKNTFGVKVNDVVLTMCAGALRKYLENRDELPDESLVSIVPVSVHDKSDRPGTNQISAMFTQLGTDIADPVERLYMIAERNTINKDHNEALGATLLQDWAQFAAPAVFGSAMRVYASLKLAERHPVVHNLVVSNVPGPPLPLYFMGARIKQMYPLGPVFHGAGLNVTVMSLNGRLDVGLVACKELAPHLWDLADAFPEALAELVKAARAHTRKQKRRAASARPAAR